MGNNNLTNTHHQTFESLKQVNEQGEESWSARGLGRVLGYAEYRNFLPVIAKAKTACTHSQQDVSDHFVDMHEMVTIGSGAKRKRPDIRLSRYACYLVVQNGDPAKPVIAKGQTYFALQTRRQELGGTMPEDLPTPDSGIRQLEKKQKQLDAKKEDDTP